MKKNITFTWLTPANIVTYSGMVFVSLSYYYLYVGDIALGVKWFVAAVLTDWLDGFTARNEALQKLFGGRGVSQQGKMLDPLRDAMLRGSIFVLAIICGIKLTLPIIIATLALATYIFFNRPINRMLGEVTVTKVGKMMQVIDCAAMIFWFGVLRFNPISANDAGLICLWFMFASSIIRLCSYFYRYLDVEDEGHP